MRQSYPQAAWKNKIIFYAKHPFKFNQHQGAIIMRNQQNNRRSFQRQRAPSLSKNTLREGGMTVHTTRSNYYSQNKLIQNLREKKKKEEQQQERNRLMLEKKNEGKVTQKDINQLWANLKRIFGSRFTSSHCTQDNGAWLNALSELTPTEIRKGFRAMTKTYQEKENSNEKMWPPNALEFYHFCRKPLSYYGLPKPVDAYRDARSNAMYGLTNWVHPAVYWAAKQVGYTRLIAEDYRQSQITFIDVYQQWIKRTREDLVAPVPNNSKIQRLTVEAKPGYVKALVEDFFAQRGLKRPDSVESR
jgi:hypothetical protein